MSKKVTLLSLTGLAPDQLADVLVENPRAYMAVKGAVAEKHLELLLAGLRERGTVASFRRGEGDFEKDFYVQLSKSDRPLAVECKNVQVISITSVGIIANYLNFLIQTKRISPLTTAAKEMTRGEFVKCFKALPIELRESGISRYEFSAMELSKGVTLKAGGATRYLDQFDLAPISIDFQRTRNSRDLKDGSDQRGQRYYSYKEVDVVAACLFTRTLKWEFVFAASTDVDCHPQFRSRIHSRMILKPMSWHHDFLKAAHRVPR